MTEFGDMRTVYGETLVKIGEENQNIVVVAAQTTHSNKKILFEKKLQNLFFIFVIA